MFHPRDVLRRPHLSEDAPNPKTAAVYQPDRLSGPTAERRRFCPHHSILRYPFLKGTPAPKYRLKQTDYKTCSRGRT